MAFIRWIMEIENENPIFRLKTGRIQRPFVLFLPILDDESLQSWVMMEQKQQIVFDAICVPDLIYEDVQKQVDSYLNGRKLLRLSQLNRDFSIFFFKYVAIHVIQSFLCYMRKLGLRHFVGVGGFNFEQPDAAYSFIKNHLDKIYAVYSMLEEDGSKELYLELLKSRITGDFSKVRFSNVRQYFCPGYIVPEKACVIDGGAYNGGTAEEFMMAMQGNGCVYGFELSTLLYEKYLAGYRGLYKEKIVFENIGLSYKREKVYYDDRGQATTASLGVKGEVFGDAIDLDSYVKEHQIHKVDFIKLDIEGAELSALYGAQKLITMWKPKMAVCLYHKTPDFWEIPLYIRELYPDCKMTLLHHFIREEEVNNPLIEKLQQQYAEQPMYKSAAETVLYVK